MIIKSIEVGDCFIHENGNKVVVKKIFCAYDEQESRWETSIAYDGINVRFTDLNTHNTVTKARNFVLMIQETGIEAGFVTHLKGYAEVTETPIDEINFAELLGGGTASNGAGVTAPTKQSEMEREFIQNASRYGLQPSDLGRTIRLNKGSRKKYKIVGAKPRNYKLPILVQGSRGGVYKVSVERVKNALLL